MNRHPPISTRTVTPFPYTSLFRSSGIVESVPASLGEQVKAGQVLATISSTSLSDLRSELLAAKKRNALAAIVYDRERKLWKEKVSAEQDYLQARAALYETEIALQNVKQKLIAIGAAGDSPSLSRLRSEEHTSELQSLMRISYAVFCLKKKKKH